MKKRVLLAGAAVIAAAAGAAAAVVVVTTKRYSKAYNDGTRLAAKSHGIPYYANVFLVVTNDKLTPVQIRELSVMTGGSVEKSEQTDVGVYTTFLLPEYHSLKTLDQLGENIGAACDYVEFAGYMGADKD